MGTFDDTKWVVASRLRDHLLLPSERKSVALWREVKLKMYSSVSSAHESSKYRFKVDNWTCAGGRVGARRFSY